MSSGVGENGPLRAFIIEIGGLILWTSSNNSSLFITLNWGVLQYLVSV